MGVGGQIHAPAALHVGKTWYQLYRRLGGLQGHSRWVQKVSPPPGCDPWTMQPIVRSYTKYAILAHALYGTRVNISCNANFTIMALLNEWIVYVLHHIQYYFLGSILRVYNNVPMLVLETEQYSFVFWSRLSEKIIFIYVDLCLQSHWWCVSYSFSEYGKLLFLD
jgi:hypothetical protein